MTRKKKSKKQQIQVRRIYYGPPGNEKLMSWPVKVIPAKNKVIINGDVIHALKAHAGVTVGCALSLTAMDDNNSKAFPHDVYIVSVTPKRLYAVDKLDKNGQPCRAVCYQHSYAHITEKNDTRVLKKMVEEQPKIMERQFTLRPPERGTHWGDTAGKNKRPIKEKKVFLSNGSGMHQGALSRAKRAGIIGDHVAEQLVTMAQRMTKKAA